MEIDDKYKVGIAITLLIVFVSLFSVSTIIFVKKYTGFLALQAEAGSITTLNIVDSRRANEWHGFMGVSVMVQNFNIQQKFKIQEYGVNMVNLLFHCMEYNIDHEVYASPTLNVDWASVEPATPEFIDSFFNISDDKWDSAVNTFTGNMSIKLGNRNITNIPASHTYQRSSPQKKYFPFGILKDGNGNPIFVTKVENDFIEGYTGDAINYQLMVAVPVDLPITYYFFSDPYDSCPEGYGELKPPANVSGTVTDKATGTPLQYVKVIIGGTMAITDTNGTYHLSVPSGDYYLTAMKVNYNNYVENISLVPLENVVKNIQMERSKEKIGDYTNPSSGTGNAVNNGVGPGQDVGPNIGPYLEKPKRTEGIDHYVTSKGINQVVRVGQFYQQDDYVFNFNNKTMFIDLNVTGNASGYVKLDKTHLVVKPNSHEKFKVTILGQGKTGQFNGSIKMSGAFDEEIPINLVLTTKEKLPIEVLLMDVVPFNPQVYPGRDLKFKIDLKNLLVENPYNVTLKYSLYDPLNNLTEELESETFKIKTSLSLIKNYPVPSNWPIGDKILKVDAVYLKRTSTVNAVFTVLQPWLQRKVFGRIPIWYLIVIVLSLNAIGILIWWLKRHIEEKKRYHLKVDYKTLPQKGGSRNVLVGKIAETNKPFYFDIDKLTIHAIVAGSTGGGKTISAQVIVEEALKNDVAVIVFDPTAQWSGFLRKNDNESMFKYYPNFGLKKEDARAFNGNVRQIQDAREKINLKKYFKPGEIQILTTDKLDPADMDIFVTNTVREVFHEHFDEASELKYLLIYDEVHRLLPRFGGSGEGFIQIERACREFRKWGIGVMLVSQVLSDFAAQIKANINTEIQMRTRDEEDLKRITTKYGNEVLRSLVKATVGTGMLENPAWNRGKPFFVTFRPILHSTYRLSDDELEKFNKYNGIIEDYEYQLEQLKEDNVDVFDIELELKLALNKVKQGNFNMVDIYIEGIKPELEKRWEKLGKKPVHKKIELVDADEIKKEFDTAKKEREKFMSQVDDGKPSEEKKGRKAEDIFKKNVGMKNAINFDNGQTATSLEEMQDILEVMDDETFARHVNDKKNDIFDWVKKVFNNEIAESVNKTSKEEIINSLKEKREELLKRENEEIEKEKKKSEEGEEKESGNDDKYGNSDNNENLNDDKNTEGDDNNENVKDDIKSLEQQLKNDIHQAKGPQTEKEIPKEEILQSESLKSEDQTEENLQSKEIPKQEKAFKVEAPKVEKAPKVEETSKVDEAPKVEEQSQEKEPDGAPKVEEIPNVDEVPKVEEQSQEKEQDDAPKVEETSKVDEAPKVEEIPNVDEVPKVEEQSQEKEQDDAPKVEETSKVDEAPKVEEQSQEEEQDEAPKVEETPKVDEVPKVEEQSQEKEQGKNEHEEESSSNTIKIAPIGQEFVLENGGKLSSVKELAGAMMFMTQEMYSHHVDRERNDFANWIEGVLHNKELADKLRSVNNKDEFTEVLKQWAG